MRTHSANQFPLAGRRTEKPNLAIFLPAIFNAADLADGGFHGEIYGKIVTGVAVGVARDSSEVFSCQFK